MESRKTKILKGFLLTVWSAGLAALTVVFAGPVLKAIRTYNGEDSYWLLGLIPVCLFMATGLHLYATMYFGLVVTVGVFCDLEAKGFAQAWAGVAAVTITSGLGAGVFGLWLSYQEKGWVEQITLSIEAPIRKVFALPAGELPFQIADLIYQIPSAVVMILSLCLFLAIVFENRVLSILGQPTKPNSLLDAFRLPDQLIWVFIPALLLTFGGFVKGAPQFIGMNIFNICLFLYFLQGLSVLYVLFKTLKISPFWQFILLVFLVLQLFVLVSVIGVADYWLDFRRRLKNRPQGVDKEFFKNK